MANRHIRYDVQVPAEERYIMGSYWFFWSVHGIYLLQVYFVTVLV